MFNVWYVYGKYAEYFWHKSMHVKYALWLLHCLYYDLVGAQWITFVTSAQ